MQKFEAFSYKTRNLGKTNKCDPYEEILLVPFKILSYLD